MIMSWQIDKHAPVGKKTVTIRTKVPWYNAKVHQARMQRRQAEHRWRHSKLEVHREIYQSKHVEVVRIIEDSKKTYYHDTISDSSKNSGQLFKTLNQLLNKKKDCVLPCHSVGSEQQLANRFAHFFHSKVLNINVYLENVRNTIGVNSRHAEPEVALCEAKLSVLNPTESNELLKIVRSSPTKSCSLDPLPTSLLKEDPVLHQVAPCLTEIVNASLSSGIVPSSFKTAYVTPLLKKTTLDKEDIKNYRPVSNLCFLSKVLERVVASRLQAHMSEFKLFETMQSAYRPHHSTETALVKVMNDLLLAVDRKQRVGLVLLDLSAAFDTVNHSILLRRLQQRVGVEGSALEWFRSYLSNRTQRVLVGGMASDEQALGTGVPQGSVLGPLLFSIYMGPLGDVIRSQGLSVHFYADDTQVYIWFEPNDTANAMSTLENCIQKIREWMAVNCLKLNDDKTEFILVSSRFFQAEHPVSIKIGEHTISSVHSARNIGAIIDSNLSLERHVGSVCKSAFYHLHNIGLVRKFLTTEATKTAIQALVTSRLDSLNALLVGLPATTIAKLQRVQNCAARVISGVGRSDHITPVLNDLHWLSVRERIEFKVLLLVFKCLNNSAPEYLHSLLNPYVPNRQLRSADGLLLSQPRSRLVNFGDRAFSCAAPRLWNRLPRHIRESGSTPVFKRNLKTFLFGCDKQ